MPHVIKASLYQCLGENFFIATGFREQNPKPEYGEVDAITRWQDAGHRFGAW